MPGLGPEHLRAPLDHPTLINSKGIGKAAVASGVAFCALTTAVKSDMGMLA